MTRKNSGRALARDEAGVFDPSTGQRAFAFVAPINAKVLFEQGYDAMLSNNLLLAKQMFAGAIAMDANFADAHILLGMAFDLLEQPKLARQHWQAYLQIAPHGPLGRVS